MSGFVAPESLRSLVVGTMCHCDDPENDYDHWSLFTRAEMGFDGEHVRRGATLNKAEMDAIVAIVTDYFGSNHPPDAD